MEQNSKKIVDAFGLQIDRFYRFNKIMRSKMDLNILHSLVIGYTSAKIKYIKNKHCSKFKK